MIEPGSIIVVTGIMASGKSTVAQGIAERVEPSVHLRGDLFRRMIVRGQAPVDQAHWDEAERQLHLRYKIATQAARMYAEAGFIVVYQDVILGDDVQRVLDLLEPGGQPVYLVVLAPAASVAAQRDRDRPKTGYGDWTADALDAALRNETPPLGLWIDSSDQSPHETVDTILERITEARIGERS
jgi:predicted kinase